MSIEVKPGRWQMRYGKTAIVEDREGKPLYPWRGVDDRGVRYSWKDDGAWVDSTTQALFDLVEYLGPKEPRQPLDRLTKPATLNTSVHATN